MSSPGISDSYDPTSPSCRLSFRDLTCSSRLPPSNLLRSPRIDSHATFLGVKSRSCLPHGSLRPQHPVWVNPLNPAMSLITGFPGSSVARTWTPSSVLRIHYSTYFFWRSCRVLEALEQPSGKPVVADTLGVPHTCLWHAHGLTCSAFVISRETKR
jgi:hypothetical protein